MHLINIFKKEECERKEMLYTEFKEMTEQLEQ